MRGQFVWLIDAIATYILAKDIGHAQQNNTNEHIANATQAVAAWTRLLVFVGAVTAGVLALQYCILRNSDETARITNRPYVFLQDVSLIGDGKDWFLIPQWVNGGNITTRDMKMRVNLVGLSEAPGVNPGFTRCDVRSQPSAPIVLGPKQVSTVAFLSTPSGTFSDFQVGSTKKLYLWGRATYHDDLSKGQRITRFCFDIEKVSGNPLDPDANLRLLHSLCPEGNCTDEDCDKEDASLPPPVCPAPKFRSAD
jgi:hypothetical protein